MSEGQTLDFAHVTKEFGDVRALTDFSASIRPGVVTGLLGPNGAGKTTTLRILLGQVRPTSGTATIGDVAYNNLKQPLRTVGSVLEEANYRPRRTAGHQLRSMAKSNGIPESRVAEVLNMVGLTKDADTRIGTLSLGMRQRLSLAGALLGDPGVLVLDEPANGLDPEGIRWMRLLMRQLADEGRTVLVSSHVLSEIEQVADDVVVLAKGRAVYAGSISSLADPTTGSVVVDAADRSSLTTALRTAGLAYDVLRSGVTVRGTDAATVGAIAASAGVALTVLHQRGPSLEEVFLDLVHGRRTADDLTTKSVNAPATSDSPELADVPLEAEAPATSLLPATTVLPAPGFGASGAPDNAQVEAGDGDVPDSADEAATTVLPTPGSDADASGTDEPVDDDSATEQITDAVSSDNGAAVAEETATPALGIDPTADETADDDSTEEAPAAEAPAHDTAPADDEGDLASDDAGDAAADETPADESPATDAPARDAAEAAADDATSTAPHTTAEDSAIAPDADESPVVEATAEDQAQAAADDETDTMPDAADTADDATADTDDDAPEADEAGNESDTAASYTAGLSFGLNTGALGGSGDSAPSSMGDLSGMFASSQDDDDKADEAPAPSTELPSATTSITIPASWSSADDDADDTDVVDDDRIDDEVVDDSPTGWTPLSAGAVPTGSAFGPAAERSVDHDTTADPRTALTSSLPAENVDPEPSNESPSDSAAQAQPERDASDDTADEPSAEQNETPDSTGRPLPFATETLRTTATSSPSSFNDLIGGEKEEPSAAQDEDEDPRVEKMRTSLAAAARAFFDERGKKDNGEGSAER